MSVTYKFPRPAYAADIVVFALTAQDTKILLVRRGGEPFKGSWALPGGFVNEGERSNEAAIRELQEETNLALKDDDELMFVGLYDAPDRDPRGWTISATYMFVADAESDVCGGDDAAEARWFSVDQLPSLAFDHAQILSDALSILTFSGTESDFSLAQGLDYEDDAALGDIDPDDIADIEYDDTEK